MILRRLYTPLGIIACPPNKYRTHGMIPTRVYTPLGIIGLDTRLHTKVVPAKSLQCSNKNGRNKKSSKLI